MHADAPSLIWLELAAVTRPSGCSSFTARIASRLASKRIPSSTVCDAVVPSDSSTSTGMISSSNQPACVASRALR